MAATPAISMPANPSLIFIRCSLPVVPAWPAVAHASQVRRSLPANRRTGESNLSERIERPTILLLPAYGDGGAGRQIGHAFGVRYLDHEVVIAADGGPDPRMVAKIDQLLDLGREHVHATS